MLAFFGSTWDHRVNRPNSGGSKEGGGAGAPVAPPPPPPVLIFFFFFYKSEVYQQKFLLNEYEMCLKMLEMAILKTQIFKNFWGGMPPDPLKSSCLRRSLVSPPPLLKILDPPLGLRYICCFRVEKKTLTKWVYSLHWDFVLGKNSTRTLFCHGTVSSLHHISLPQSSLVQISSVDALHTCKFILPVAK